MYLAEIQPKTLAYARGSHLEKNAIIICGRGRVPHSVVLVSVPSPFPGSIPIPPGGKGSGE